MKIFSILFSFLLLFLIVAFVADVIKYKKNIKVNMTCENEILHYTENKVNTSIWVGSRFQIPCKEVNGSITIQKEISE